MLFVTLPTVLYKFLVLSYTITYTSHTKPEVKRLPIVFGVVLPAQVGYTQKAPQKGVDTVTWWIGQGYHCFDAGKDGYPLPGQVVTYYRKARGATQKSLASALQRSVKTVREMQNQEVGLDSFSLRCRLSALYDIPPALLGLDLDKPASLTPPGQIIKHYRRLKRWTQLDLADALEITDKAVRDMENKNAGLDSITRRRILSDMLKIPPALLGIAALEVLIPTEVKAIEQKPDIASLHLALPSYWEKHLSSTAKGDTRELLLKIGMLHDAVLYAKGQDKKTVVELLCRYHILVAFIVDDHPQFQTALLHLNRATILAKSLGNKELYAAALYRRGNAFFVKGDTEAAINDYSLSFRNAVSDQLRGAVLLKLGQAQAKAAQDKTAFTAALKMLDVGGKIAQKWSTFGEDEHFLKLRPERYHLDRASALLSSPISSLRFPGEALNELDFAAEKDVTCRSAYSSILQARAYVEKGWYPVAATLAEEALPTVRKIQSGVNLARIQTIYQALSRSPYGDSPDVARLGSKILR
jgi:transcriptional regulator with XRE-family HTH domain